MGVAKWWSDVGVATCKEWSDVGVAKGWVMWM